MAALVDRNRRRNAPKMVLFVSRTRPSVSIVHVPQRPTFPCQHRSQSVDFDATTRQTHARPVKNTSAGFSTSLPPHSSQGRRLEDESSALGLLVTTVVSNTLEPIQQKTSYGPRRQKHHQPSIVECRQMVSWWRRLVIGPGRAVSHVDDPRPKPPSVACFFCCSCRSFLLRVQPDDMRRNQVWRQS